MIYAIECNGRIGLEKHGSIEEAKRSANAEFGSRNSPHVRTATEKDIAWWEAMTGKTREDIR